MKDEMERARQRELERIFWSVLENPEKRVQIVKNANFLTFDEKVSILEMTRNEAKDQLSQLEIDTEKPEKKYNLDFNSVLTIIGTVAGLMSLLISFWPTLPVEIKSAMITVINKVKEIF